jgi:hypothetical protein
MSREQIQASIFKETAMSTDIDTYQQVLRQVRKLTPEQQLGLMEELLTLLRSQVVAKPGPGHTVMELEGLGKEIWEGIDAQQYIEEERNSWGG